MAPAPAATRCAHTLPLPRLPCRPPAPPSRLLIWEPPPPPFMGPPLVPEGRAPLPSPPKHASIPSIFSSPRWAVAATLACPNLFSEAPPPRTRPKPAPPESSAATLSACCARPTCQSPWLQVPAAPPPLPPATVHPPMHPQAPTSSAGSVLRSRQVSFRAAWAWRSFTLLPTSPTTPPRMCGGPAPRPPRGPPPPQKTSELVLLFNSLKSFGSKFKL